MAVTESVMIVLFCKCVTILIS